MKNKFLFIVDSKIQSSLYMPWKRACENCGISVEIFSFEKAFDNLGPFFRLFIIKKFLSWTRKQQQRYFFQKVITYLFQPFYYLFTKGLNNVLLSKVEKDSYDSVMVFKGSDLLHSSLKSINSKGIKTVCLNGDSPFNMLSSNKNILQCISEYSFYVCWSKSEKNYLEKNNNANTVLMPFACEKIESDDKPDLNYDLKNSMVFIGAWDKERELFIKELNIKKMVIFGPGWEKSDKFFLKSFTVCTKRLTLNQMSYIYANSLCALNILRPQNQDSHNMKTFEITGMGCCMIAPNTPDHMRFFDEHDSVFLFDEISEIEPTFLKISQISKEELKKKCLRTKNKILKKHSYVARVHELKDLLFE